MFCEVVPWSGVRLPVQETPETRARFPSQDCPLEEDVAARSGVPAWRIPRTEEPGGLQSVGSQRVGRD